MKDLLTFLPLQSCGSPLESKRREAKSCIAVFGHLFREGFAFPRASYFFFLSCFEKGCSSTHLNSLKSPTKFSFSLLADINSPLQWLDSMWFYSAISTVFVHLFNMCVIFQRNSGLIFDEVAKHPFLDYPLQHLLDLFLLVDHFRLFFFFWKHVEVAKIVVYWNVVEAFGVNFTATGRICNKVH